MVYVLQGNFYAGDNSVASLNGQFEAGNTKLRRLGYQRH